MLQLINSEQINEMLALRSGETKIGEKVVCGNIDHLKAQGVQYVILGIEECVGPKANLGNGGADKAWNAFLKAFLNIQNNQFLDGSIIGLLGSLSFDVEVNEVDHLRLQTHNIDEAVESIIFKVQSAGMTPIVIGGGHNNAFPLIVSSAKTYGSINAINCDPHADFRPLEGRHSGNGFSFAMNGGYLNKYFILGLHQSYNGNSIFQQFDEANSDEVKVLWTYLDNWLYGKSTFEKDLAIGLEFVKDKKVGLELDMDAISMMPSSAIGPSGLRLNDARRYVAKCASELDIAYLHLPEAAPSNEFEDKMVGKSLAYLVSDFIKNN